jgi:outer membrane protein
MKALILVTIAATLVPVSTFAQAAGQPQQTQPAVGATTERPPLTAPSNTPLPFPVGAKSGFVDLQRVFRESAEGKSLAARLNVLGQQKQSENGVKQKTLQDAQQQLKTSGGAMSEPERTQLQKDIERQQMELQRFQQDAQAELNKLQGEIKDEFLSSVNPVLGQIATEKQLEMILTVGGPPLVWYDPRLDLSAEIVKRLDLAQKPSAK